MTGFTVLGGYLGSGKTTLLNHILRDDHGLRLALLINDFGSINIDAALIESQDEQQVNLANGCICCNLSDGFFEALDTLKTMQPPPDHIIVEASGVADVHNLGQYGYTADLELSGLIVLADAETVETKANDKYVAETVRRQLRAADLIVLNKQDLVSPAQLADTQEWLAQFNTCPVIPTQQGQIPLTALLGIDSKFQGYVAGQHQQHAHYETWQLVNTQQFTEQALTSFVERARGILRLKGIVRAKEGSLQIQVVGRRVEFTAKETSVEQSQLVAIGLAQTFHPRDLDELARSIFSEMDPAT
ncbi:MAG: hypothetical protein GKR90_15845 [Pseudomonadales bacterium]|nr:hypothetical protein [Pseudomonadales bacterium]